MKKYYKINCLTLIICCFFCFLQLIQAMPGFAGETNIYLINEYFDWQEFVNGKRFVRESGLRMGIGLNHNIEFYKNQLFLKSRFEIIGGQVDYDSSTKSNVLVESNSDYYDGKVEIDMGYNIRALENVSIDPFFGTGLRGWYRNIKDAIASDGVTNIYGYSEEWYSVFFRTGIKCNVALGLAMKLFMEAGGKFPVYNENKAHFDESGLGPDVTFKTGHEISWFAEIGVKYKLFNASFYYDSMRFSKSDIVYSRGFDYYQPKSEDDIYGIRVGIGF